MKNWIKEHESTVTTIGATVALWFAVTHSFKQDMDKFDARLISVENRVIDMDKRLTSVETILLMQGCHLKTVSAEKDN